MKQRASVETVQSAELDGRPALSPLARWRRFLLLWAAQTSSMAGSGVTSFALGVWVYTLHHSATEFSLISFCTTLPGIVILPIAGAWVDRWGSARALVVSDLGGALCAATLAVLYATHHLALWALYVILTLSACAGALHWPAYTAASTMLVPTERLPRVGSLMNLGYAAQQLAAPMLAGALIGLLGVGGLIAIDVASYAFAIATLVLVVTAVRAPAAAAARPDLLAETKQVWAYLRARPGLLSLTTYVAVTYFFGGFVIALASPFVLSQGTPRELGAVLTFTGVGMVLGIVTSGGLASRAGGLTRVFLFDLLSGVAMGTMGLVRTSTGFALAGFAFAFGLGGLNSESQVIFQLRVEPVYQGRAFALRRALAWAPLPLSYGLAGPIADHLFVPLLAPSGPLVSSLGAVFGVGPGRGIGLVLSVAGVCKIAVALLGSRAKSLRPLADRAQVGDS